MTATMVELGPGRFEVQAPWLANGHNGYDVAHVVAVTQHGPNRVLAAYKEPCDRESHDWDCENELRDAIEAHVRSWLSDALNPGEGCAIQYDPGRDQCEEVELCEAE